MYTNGSKTHEKLQFRFDLCTLYIYNFIVYFVISSPSCMRNIEDLD